MSVSATTSRQWFYNCLEHGRIAPKKDSRSQQAKAIMARKPYAGMGNKQASARKEDEK